MTGCWSSSNKLDHLGRGGPDRIDDRVAEQNHEGLVVDVITGITHGVAEAQHLLLPDKVNIGQLRDAAHGLQFRGLALRFQLRLKLKAAVEMLLDGAFARADDHEQIGDARLDRLLDDVLDHGRIDNRQHLLRLRLRGREKAGAESGGGNDGFANHALAFPVPGTILGLMTVIFSLRSVLRNSANIRSFSYAPTMAPPEPVNVALAPMERAVSTIRILSLLIW